LGSLKTVLYHPVHISSLQSGTPRVSLTVPGNVWLAPMAGYTDAAFRSVCARHGASLCFAEMVSADALSRDNGTTFRLLARAPQESLIGYQIFASSAAAAGAAVKRIAPRAPALIDLNCGCSVPKVLKAGCGAVLLSSPPLIGAMVAAMQAETDIPISVKLRSGRDSSSLNFLDCAEAAWSSGASLVTLHPRTRAQGFSGKSEWDHIRRLKEACPVPVFGSGDLFTAADCASMLERTGCDGVMLARGCLGNPFLFREAEALLSGREDAPAIDERVKLETAMEHLRMLALAAGEQKACRDMRKHFVAYTKGMPGGSLLRQSVVTAETIAEYQDIVESYLRD
jgi:tRNA-dihydrouridine synthase B